MSLIVILSIGYRGWIKIFSSNRNIVFLESSVFTEMSIVPLVFRDWWEDMDRPVSRIWDQYFGRGLNRDDLISEFSNLGINRPFPTPFRSLLGNNSTYYRPWRTVTRQNSGGSSTIKMEKDNFQVCKNLYLDTSAIFFFFCYLVIDIRGIR